MAGDGVERRLAAILCADVVGYSRLMGQDETGTVVRLKALRAEFVDPTIAEYQGRIVKLMGDGVLVEFPSVVNAVECAVTVQRGMFERNADIPKDKRIALRIGVNLGDIIIDGDDILGDGVNVAARLEAIAPPSGLCVSDMVRQNLRGAVGESFEDLGEQSLKNIERKVRVWRWPAADDGQVGASRTKAAEHGEHLPPTIAVLPFEALSPDTGHRFYAEGFAEDIATAISKLDTLRVVSAESSESADAAQFHVKGSVRVAGPRIRCNVQLIEVADRHHLWSERFDGQVEDVFDYQDRITEQVVAALEIELAEGQQVRLWRQEAGDPLAYEDFLKGRAAHKEYSRPGNARARSAFESALDRSPTFHSAAVGLARTHVDDAVFGWSVDRDESLREARRVLDGVFAIDPNHSFAHMQLAHALLAEGDFPAARLEAELAIALDPNNADAHTCLAFALLCLELPEEALRSARRAIGLNPGTPEFYFIAATEALIALRRYQEALAVSEKIIAKRPAWITARILKVLALQGLGKETEAGVEVQRLLEDSPNFTAERWRRIIFYPDRPDIPDLIGRLVSAGLPAGEPGAQDAVR